MDKQEIKKQLEMSYAEQLIYLKNKYGRAKENYYLDVDATRKSSKNGRGNEGLYLHHDYEYDPDNCLVQNLSKAEMAKTFDYKYQYADNLTYCNYIEHLILHIKINLLRKEQLGRYINDGLVNFMIPELNDWYRYRIKLVPWKQVAFELIKDNYVDYCELIEYWLNKLEVADFDWKKLTTIRK